jgi:23S rRNA (cytidine1920-2'-O)/16S rRNA (cytidine1409-2'-O)-methyltransferase
LKERLDKLLVDRGLVQSRERARAMILAGDVLVNEAPVTKAGSLVDDAAEVRLRSTGIPYVSRGGVKLAGALEGLAIDPTGRVCLDVGASTGGFTDVLLRGGAARVYAVDVGYGQLAWSLRSDPRVVCVERCNARALSRAEVPEPISLVVVDVSFISVTLVLPALVPLCAAAADVLAMVKPQFEAGRGAAKRGVVRDPQVRAEAIERVKTAALALGLVHIGGADATLPGPKGNLEHFLHLRVPSG